MSFSFTIPRAPNPFGHSLKKNARDSAYGPQHSAYSKPERTDLQYYPLVRGMRAVNRQQTNLANAQRSMLSAENAKQAPGYVPEGSPLVQGQPLSPGVAYEQGQSFSSGVPYGQGLSSGTANRQQGQGVSQAQQATPTMQNYPPQSPVDQAEQLRRINRNLPDGVQYEPLDEKTIQMLRASGKLPDSALPKHTQQNTNIGSNTAQPTPPVNPQNQFTQPTPQPVPPSGSPETFTATVSPKYPPNPLAQAVPQKNPPNPLAQAAPAFAPSSFNSNINGTPTETPIETSTEASTGTLPETPLDPRALSIERLFQDERNAYVYYNYLTGLSPRMDFQSALSSIAEQCKERMLIYGSLLEGLFSRRFTPIETVINTTVDFKAGVELAVIEENKSLRALSELLDKLDDQAAAKTIQNIINRKIVDHNLLIFMKTEEHT